MKSKLLSLILLSGLILIQSTPNGYFSQEFFDSGNANAFVEKVLISVKTKYAKSLDPFHIPDKTFSFSKKVGFLTFDGSAKLNEGVINGLSHLYRSGDSTLGTENKHFVAHLRMGDDNIRVGYKVSVSFMYINSHVTLESEVENIDMKATIVLGADGKLSLTDFHIEKLKHVKVHIHGLGILDHLVDLIADKFIDAFNPTVRDLLSNAMKDMIGDMLKYFKLPLLFN